MDTREKGALEARNLFKKRFGYTPLHEAQAPGRLELLGNHTDYNEGLVMSLAVDKYLFVAASPRQDGKVELVSTAFEEKAAFSISEIKKDTRAPWADYVKGVLAELRKHQVHFSGFQAAIHGTVPMGAGMSSSAALEVATALLIRELHPYTITDTGSTVPPKRDRKGSLRPMKKQEKIEMARLCQAAENNFVGVKCGLLDQISSLFGEAFHAIQIDCKHLSVETIPMIGDIAILICNSGVKHSLVGGEYNELREQCEGAARALGVKALRSVDMPQLKKGKAKLTERQYQCAYHVVGEIQRVIHGEQALRNDDFEQFGQYMFQSHESSRDYFGNSIKELDLLVEIARRHPATLGARLTGGGFGGATINLIRRGQLADFKVFMAKEYKKASGVSMEPMLCQIVDGARGFEARA